MHWQRRSSRSGTFGTVALALTTLAYITGCNGLTPTTTVPTPGTTPQVFMTPEVAGNPSDATAQLASYTIDLGSDCSIATAIPCFSQATTSFTLTQQGTEVNNSGVMDILARGLEDLGTTYSYPYGSGVALPGTQYDPPLFGSFAVELADQAGGLVQLLGSAATPMVATSACPTLAAAQTFQFVTLPSAVTSTGPGSGLTWNPALDTAYGSVSVATNGDAVTLSHIQQFTLPLNGNPAGTPANPVPSPVPAGVCTSTSYGRVATLPAVLTVTDPGSGQSATAASTIGIGPSNMLVEDNGTSGGSGSYNNILGAGTGAVGLPVPSGPLGSGPVGSGAEGAPEYLGFAYSTGNASNASDTGWTSNLVSFGLPAALQTSCAAFQLQTGILTNGIFGGDYPADPATGLPNPNLPVVQGNGGYGNCDLAVDLGLESSASPGLYPAATVWIGSQFVANKTVPSVTYSFPAVAVSGQLHGKYAIFVIGFDAVSQPNQAWSLHLLQSN